MLPSINSGGNEAAVNELYRASRRKVSQIPVGENFYALLPSVNSGGNEAAANEPYRDSRRKFFQDSCRRKFLRFALNSGEIKKPPSIIYIVIFGEKFFQIVDDGNNFGHFSAADSFRKCKKPPSIHRKTAAMFIFSVEINETCVCEPPRIFSSGGHWVSRNVHVCELQRACQLFDRYA